MKYIEHFFIYSLLHKPFQIKLLLISKTIVPRTILKITGTSQSRIDVQIHLPNQKVKQLHGLFTYWDFFHICGIPQKLLEFTKN